MSNLNLLHVPRSARYIEAPKSSFNSQLIKKLMFKKAEIVFEKLALDDDMKSNIIMGGAIGAAGTIPSYMPVKKKDIAEFKKILKYDNLVGASRAGKKINSKEIKFAKNLLKNYKPATTGIRGAVNKILPKGALEPTNRLLARKGILENKLKLKSLPLTVKGLRTVGKGAELALLSLGLSALIKGLRKDE